MDLIVNSLWVSVYKRKLILLLSLALILVSCNTDSREQKQVKSDKLATSQRFVDFTLPGLDGKQHSLQDFKSKLTLVNFWATWCSPCIAELPSLQKLYSRYSREDLDIVAISVDSKDSIEDVRSLKKKLGLNFNIIFDHDLDLPPKLGITGFPETFFVGSSQQMLAIYDPREKTKTIKIISDRDWDSPQLRKSIDELLGK